ncbi:hypothetical protein F5Y10DRAFT_274933 [Nemania abortiva]|nr:hypothetical protein F5Y10DRAFT_274933 [Nemania abortiva]
MAAEGKSDIQILASLVDDEEDGEYRVLVDVKHVRYLAVDFRHAATFSPGNWNEGRIRKHPDTGERYFSKTTKSDLAGVENIWHRTQIDHLELEVGPYTSEYLLVTHSLFKSPEIAKFTEFPWQTRYLKAKTTGYEWIDGKESDPSSSEYLDGARTAEPEDLSACQAVHAKLHSLDILHGDTNKQNFLVHDGKAVLVDFDKARRCDEKEELESEFRNLEK